MNIINDMLVDKCFPDNVNARTVVPAYKDKTASGNPITLTDSAENKPLGMTLYGWSKQDGTPSPDNPVEIESAGMKWSTGKNLLDYSIMKSKTAYGVTLKNNNDGTFLLQGVCTESFNFIADNVVTLKAGTYTIAANANRIAINDNNPCVQLYNSDKNVGVDVLNNSALVGFNTKTFVEDIELQYIIRIQKGVNYDGFILKPMLVAGSEILPYEPYTGGVPKPYGDKVGVSVRGKNLFDERLLDDESNYNKQYQSLGYWILAIPVKNGLVTVSVKNTTNWGGYLCVNSTGIVGDVGGVWMAHGSVSHLKRTATLTITHGFVYLLMSKSVDTNKRTLEEVGYIQVEYGTEATSYEPYRTPQSTAIITPNGLPGIPVPSNTAGITYTDAKGQAWIADEIDFARGKYIQRVWQAEFDGSENWLVYDYMKGFILVNAFPYTMTNRAYLSNQYLNNLRIGMGQNVLYLDSSSFYDASLDDRGLSNFKAHLAANPLVVMTYLDTPIERDLTTAELAEYTQLYSYKPTTVVENNSGCWMDVTYKAGTSGKSKNEALRWYFKNVMPLVG